ncbi:hypothetical protein AVEN_14032-1 [Araneus ventricosus]|uniref:Uncharacterized protein n=1 Tax=Araneus ventricosus TaxID=182803 RepID=A0A4Y2P8D1_ARAVE|nr:hypothetical protein AVEN_14032-1 [Araneus ventricosus]
MPVQRRRDPPKTWQFAKNQFWRDFIRKQTFRESRQVLLRKRMGRGFEFVLILQTTRGSNFGLLATEVYLTSFTIIVFSTCVRSIRESLGEITPAGFFQNTVSMQGSAPSHSTFSCFHREHHLCYIPVKFRFFGSMESAPLLSD